MIFSRRIIKRTEKRVRRTRLGRGAVEGFRKKKGGGKGGNGERKRKTGEWKCGKENGNINRRGIRGGCYTTNEEGKQRRGKEGRAVR